METLKKIEALIQKEFKNGLLPHLQPNAKNCSYIPGSDQSSIFVALYEEYKKLDEMDVQKILHNRVILVHGNPLDYDYGWNIKSLALLYDVDKKMMVHGEITTLIFLL